MKFKLIILLLILVVLPFTGCLSSPKTDTSSDGDIPEFRLELDLISPKTIYQYYALDTMGDDEDDSWDVKDSGGKATEDYFWVDVKNTGRKPLHDIKLYISNEPDKWEIYEIDPIAEPGSQSEAQNSEA